MSLGRLLAIAGCFAMSAGNCLALSEEEYLKYIDAEASKLSGPSTSPVPRPEAVESPENGDAARLNQKEFERLLRARARGTYSFYESLVEKDKAEVFKAYAGGASMQQIRRMIINRKMNR